MSRIPRIFVLPPFAFTLLGRRFETDPGCENLINKVAHRRESGLRPTVHRVAVQAVEQPWLMRISLA
jgi:hypothetical protein